MSIRMYFENVTLRDIKVGDEVTRNMGCVVTKTKVTELTDTTIICGPWKFSKRSGVEIDNDLSEPASYITKET